MEQKEIEIFVEAALLAAGRPLSLDQIKGLFDGRSAPDKSVIRKVIESLNEQYEERGIVISEVASGFRMQVKPGMAERLGRLWEERPPRYSRALFETLALIAYRQPITRSEIEEIRGVSVSSNIMRSLVEREWVRVVGHRDVPGRPAMFGTTKAFLDYFSLTKLEDLPELADLSDWESLRVQLDLPDVDEDAVDEMASVSALPVAQNDDAQPDEQEQAGEEVDETDLPALNELESAAAQESEAEEDTRNETAESSADDELSVSEWPDPSDVRSVASLETSSPDKDASANNG